MLGGKDQALQALKESTIVVEPLEVQILIPPAGPMAGQVFGGYKKAQTKGKNIILGSNTIFAPDGKISTINLATHQPLQIPVAPADINEVGAAVAHETAHRAKSTKIKQDDGDLDDSKKNDDLVRDACGYKR